MQILKQKLNMAAEGTSNHLACTCYRTSKKDMITMYIIRHNIFEAFVSNFINMEDAGCTVFLNANSSGTKLTKIQRVVNKYFM